MLRSGYRIAKVHIRLLGETLEWCRLDLSRCLLEGLDTASQAVQGPARVPRRAHHVISCVSCELRRLRRQPT
jgi:hypothetical protein